MNIRDIAISGFRSFGRDQVLRFPVESGLYLLSGANEVEPHLGANGAGKSSLWDALIWVFFAKTARGTRGGAVRNWDEASPCSVLVTFELRLDSYVLTRTWNPNSLLLEKNGEEAQNITQEELEKLIGFDHTTFTNTVVMGQFGRLFFDLSATEKLEMFSRALDLDVWLQASGKARDRRGESKAREQKTREAISTLEGRLITLREARKSAKEAESRFEINRASRIEQSRRSITKMTEQLDDLRDTEKEARKEIQTQRGYVATWEERVAKAAEGPPALVELAAKRQAEKAGINDRMVKLQRELEKYRSLTGVCPHCNQKVDKNHSDSEANRVIRGQISLSDDLRSLEGDIKSINERLGVANTALQDVIRNRRSQDLALQKAIAAHGIAKSDVEKCEAKIQDDSKLIGLIEKETNPHTETLERTKKQIEQVKDKVEEKEDELNKATRETSFFDYWVGGFKDVRLWLISQALNELSVYTNNALPELGLHGWKVHFDVERENTSGGVTKGFTVLISSPHSRDLVPWDAWSGGETQRLRIAGAVGMANLISDYRGLHSNIEVWDEPTAHLSEIGTTELLEFLKTRSTVNKKQIWLVDHRTLNFGAFNGEWRVIKTSKGSEIHEITHGSDGVLHQIRTGPERRRLDPKWAR